MTTTNDTAYAARKAERINAMVRNPRCAIVSLVKYCAKRGYRFELRTGEESFDELCPATTDPRVVLAAVWEIESECFWIVDANGNHGGQWAYLMWPGAANCDPDESVVDRCVSPMLEAWADEFHTHPTR